MRILHVISSLNPNHGGPVTALAGMAAAQKAAGLDVRVAASWREPVEFETIQRLKALGVPTDVVGPCHGPLIRHPQLAEFIHRQVEQSDVVHTHTMWEEIQHQAAVAARRLGKKLIITPHGMIDRWSMRTGRWKKLASLWWRVGRDLRAADAIHFTTEPERRAAGARAAGRPNIIEPLGVDLSEFDPPPRRGTFRARHPQLGDKPAIIYLGRIDEKKGLEYLIPAMAKLRDRTAMLVIAGPDHEGFAAVFQKMIDSHGLSERVIFTGMLRGAERIAALADADLFCMPSEHKNFGIAVIESLAAGTPVIVSDQVNVHEEIVAAGVGAAVRCDIAAVAHELDRWLADDALRRRAAQAAFPFVRQRYDWNAIARRWGEHYERLSCRPATS